MPSHLHETLVEMFRHHPMLAAELLSDALGLTLPAFDRARLDPGEFTDVAPTEYRADAVVTLTDADGPELAVVVEVQLRRDPAKQWSWPVYLTSLRARLRCPAVLLVLCVDAGTAAWAATPIDIGHPRMRLTPLVLSPDLVPTATGTSSPELAVLAAMAHGADPSRSDVLETLLDALAAVDQDHATLYSDLVLSALPEAARRHLEALVSVRTREYQSEFVRKYVFQGRAEGRAEARVETRTEAILAVLDARGLAVPDDIRARITATTDADLLNVWLRRAVTIEDVARLVD